MRCNLCINYKKLDKKMDEKIVNSCFAFVAMCQSCELVARVSKGQEVSPWEYDSLFRGIAVTDADSITEVYPNPRSLKLGMDLYEDALRGRRKNTQMAKYVFAVINLTLALMRDEKALEELSQAIKTLPQAYEFFTIDNPTLHEKLALIYKNIISPAGPRVVIMGNRDALDDPAAQNLIRALLLSAVRATVLWRQVGGRRRNLLFQRRDQLHALMSMQYYISRDFE